MGEVLTQSANLRGISVVGLDNDYIMPVNLNLKEYPLTLIHEVTGEEKALNKCYPSYMVVNCLLQNRQTNYIADNFIIFGRHILVQKPRFKRVIEIDSAMHGYAGDYSETDNDSEFNIYEKFIVTESGCDYKLPPSYDQIAFNSFRVVQSEGTDCIFRDWRGTIIFDGTRYGAGTFTIKARNIDDNPWSDNWDNAGQAWDVYRGDELIDTDMPVSAEN